MTCAEAARVLSDRMDRPMGPRTRAALRFHLLLCSGCRHYERQLAFIRRWLRIGRLKRSEGATEASARLGEKARARIQAAIDERLKG